MTVIRHAPSDNGVHSSSPVIEIVEDEGSTQEAPEPQRVEKPPDKMETPSIAWDRPVREWKLPRKLQDFVLQ
jgi:hypothetical protein